jgi:4-amino-4-deoxy-L-arabinose transferase-like glycosyltransferase
VSGEAAPPGAVRARRAAGGALLCAAALGAGAGAQALLRSRPPEAAGYALAAATLVLAFAAARSVGRAAWAPQPGAAPAGAPRDASLSPPRPRWAALAAAALALALGLQAAAAWPALSLAAWAAALVAWNAAFHAPGALRPARGDLLVPAALYAAALAGRAFGLADAPGGLYGDEAVFGLHARALLAGERIDPFGEGMPQIPALWTWLQAGAMAVLGDGVGGLRASSALLHAAASPLLYTLLRRDLGALPAAGGALVLAFAPWSLHFGRLALNEAALVPCTIGAFAALLAALRAGGAGAWVRAGTFVALCFYAGNKAVLLPPALIAGGAGAWLAVRAHARPGAAPIPWRGLLLLAATALLAFAPQLPHAFAGGWHGLLVSHPQRWLASPGEGAGWGAQLALLARALLDHPDTSVFTGWPGMRLVGAGEAALFVVGLGVALARPARPLAALLLGWLLAGLGSLVVDERPVQLHHMVLLAPVPAAFGALALHAAQDLVARATARPTAGRTAALAVAAAVALQGGHAYFGLGAQRWSYAEVAALGHAMRELAPSHHLVLVTPPMSWDLNSTLLYLAPGVRARDKLVELPPARRWLEPPGRDVAFLVDGRSAALLQRIRARYPDAAVEERRAPPARLRLAVVRVPAERIARVEGALAPSD